MTPSPGPVDQPPTLHVSETKCYAPGCTWIAELGEAWCAHHGGGDLVEQLREADR